MSSNYCVQLNLSSAQPLEVIAMFTSNPVNFNVLQFSLSVNSLVIFLFSKYPFNFGYGHYFCVNPDEFGFAQVGQNFIIDLSLYQGYYMLILIYPEGIEFYNVGTCQIVPNLTMTFQNTTISPVQNMTIQSNYDQQQESGFCKGYNIQSTTPQPCCNNYTIYSIISLDNLNNYLVITTCQAFLIQNNTSVQFVTPCNCHLFSAFLSADIKFLANQQVIDFLENNHLSYSILFTNECQISYKFILCKPFYQITKLLSPPKKYSLISSKLWNEIIQDLYLAYSVYKYINYLSQFPYPQNIYNAIIEFYDFYENFKPYVFTPLIHARKGLPLTADYFNSLIDAIIHLANFANIQLQKGLSYVQPDEIVKALQFDYVVDNVNQLLTFNYHQYFLLSCYGNEFNNLLKSTTTFLNVLIANLMDDITIQNNVYVKNLLIYNNFQTITIYGTIANLVMNINEGTIQLLDNSSINSFILQNNKGTIEIEDNSNINILQINQNPGTININGNSNIVTLKIQNNSGVIEINDYAIIGNLICKQNTGTVNISSTALVINNQCS